ncbi:fumarylacetoacetate hydrolase family protein [Dongia soli]|uniref:Fumarylacetoacetate hydrolase family protein n=1 Tax=Dongia soli TaxID=600628 RepID=A0ABU5EDM6_9PROT|nr:fumarylacetoacetate hydrolase family protein [Dongia soli]MDY0884444.1 fumarylacetoacetate hydrolase family protein [Dongia soli]
MLRYGPVGAAKTGKYIAEADALDYVAGYCVANDVSEREFQIERAGTWTTAKAAIHSGRSEPGR